MAVQTHAHIAWFEFITCQLTQSFMTTGKHTVRRKMSSRVGRKTELELAPSLLKSKVWKDLGSKVFYDDKDLRNVVKEILICRHCFLEQRSTGSMTNMSFYVQRHHPWSASAACSSIAVVQEAVKQTFLIF